MQHGRNLIQEHLCQPRALRRDTVGMVLTMSLISLGYYHWFPEARYEHTYLRAEIILEYLKAKLTSWLTSTKLSHMFAIPPIARYNDIIIKCRMTLPPNNRSPRSSITLAYPNHDY